MVKIMNLTFLESKKVFKRKGIYIGILLSALFASAIGYQAIKSPESFNIKHVNAFFSSIATIVIYIYASKSLGEEFDLKTSTQVFTSKIPRVHIVFSKLLSIVFIGLVLAIVNTIVGAIVRDQLNESLTLNTILNDLWINAYIYTIYSFVVGSFAFIISAIFLTSMAGIIASIAAFMIGPNIFGLISTKVPSLDWIVKRIPFYASDNMISNRLYGTVEIISLIASGVIFFIIAAIIISKKDLR